MSTHSSRHRARPPPSVRQLVSHFTSTEMPPRPSFDPEQGRRIIEAGLGLPPTADRGILTPRTSTAAAGDKDDAVGGRENAEEELRPDLCLAALQMLMGTRARAKDRRRPTPTRGDSRLSAQGQQTSGSATPAPSKNAPPTAAEITTLPTLQPDLELPAAGMRPPRPPQSSPRRFVTPQQTVPRAPSSRPSRPATVAARAEATRPTGEAADSSSRFFLTAVESAARLTTLQLETRIPAQFWVMETTPFSTEASTTQGGATGSIRPPEVITGYSGDTGTATFTRRHFPSAVPNNKAEVTQLARCLDRLLQERVPDPGVLHDSAAFFKLPDLVEPAVTRASTLLGAQSRQSDSTAAVVSVASVDPYVVAAEALLEVCDVGMCECVRHVASQNIVLASLIDNLRAVCVDVARNCVEYVTSAKHHVELQRQHAEELKAQLLALQEKQTATASVVEALQRQLDEVTAERDELLMEQEAEEELDARDTFRDFLNAAENARFSQVDVLQTSILQSSMSPQGGGAFGDAKISFDVPEDDQAVSGSASPSSQNLNRIRSVGALAVPVVGAQRARRRSLARRPSVATSEADTQFDGQITYHALVPFLDALHRSITATDAACGPFFASTLLNQPQLGVSVASSRWVSLATTIGIYENSNERKTTTHDTESGATAALAKHVSDVRLAGALRQTSVSPGEVVLVLHEVTTTMTELAARLVALAKSPELERVARPELMPPLQPEVPCALCHRVQVVEAFHNTKDHVLRSGVVELVAKPLREEIEVLKLDLEDAEDRENVLKKRLEELKAKLRAVESEKLKESTQAAVGGTLTPVASMGRLLTGDQSNPLHPGNTDGPLMINLVINCHCNDLDSPVASKSGSRPGSSRNARPTSKSPAASLTANRRLSSPHASATPVAPKRTPSALDKTDPLDIESSSASGVIRAAMKGIRRKPPRLAGLSPEGSNTAIIVRADQSPLSSPHSGALTEDELRRLIDFDQTTYRFPLFATSRDPRVLLTLGTASPQSITLTANKTLPWVLKQISHFYRSKLMHDLTADFERIPRRTFPEFILDVALRHKYGDPRLSNDAAASLFAGCQAYFVDERVDLFARFVVEFYPTPVLHSCLKLQRALDDLCLGPQYSLVCNDDETQHRPLSVLVVRRVAVALTQRPDTSVGEKAALANLANHALFHSEQASQDDALKALGRATITAQAMSRWSAEEREEAYRVVPRSRVLSRYCEDLQQLLQSGKDRLSPNLGSTGGGGDEPGGASYVFPTLASGDEGEPLPPPE